MLRLFTVIIILLFSIPFVGFSQSGDPEKILKYSDKKDRLDDYMKKYKWKKAGSDKDEEGDVYYLFKRKSYGGGTIHLAVFPGKFIHYQKYNSEKHDYSYIMAYSDFIYCPIGKTKDVQSISSEISHIKSISIEDPQNSQNENNFYGYIPPEIYETVKSIENAKSVDFNNEASDTIIYQIKK